MGEPFAGVEMIGGQEGSDPASVVYDAVAAAKARNADVLISDTAGRLHNKKNLMEELRKINRIMEREYPDAYLRDTGSAGWYHRTECPCTGERICGGRKCQRIILTKLDGTAKGGIRSCHPV